MYKRIWKVILNSIMLEKVFLVEGITYNLIYMSQLCISINLVLFNKHEGMVISRSNNEVVVNEKQKGLNVLNTI